MSFAVQHIDSCVEQVTVSALNCTFFLLPLHKTAFNMSHRVALSVKLQRVLESIVNIQKQLLFIYLSIYLFY